MSDYCGQCVYFDTNQKELLGNRYYCTKTCKYKEVNEQSCYNFIVKPDGGYKPAGCFITTMICEMLGYDDDCDLLTKIRLIRENYLKKTDEGRLLLQEYDIIGPVLSNKLSSESLLYSLLLTQKYLLPCYELINDNKFKEATNVYINMVTELKNKFSYALDNANLDYNMHSLEDDLGKGRVRIQTIKV